MGTTETAKTLGLLYGAHQRMMDAGHGALAGALYDVIQDARRELAATIKDDLEIPGVRRRVRLAISGGDKKSYRQDLPVAEIYAGMGSDEVECPVCGETISICDEAIDSEIFLLRVQLPSARGGGRPMTDTSHAIPEHKNPLASVLTAARSWAHHHGFAENEIRGAYLYRNERNRDIVNWCTASFRRAHPAMVSESRLICWIDEEGLVGEVYEEGILEGLMETEELEDATYDT